MYIYVYLSEAVSVSLSHRVWKRQEAQGKTQLLRVSALFTNRGKSYDDASGLHANRKR